MCMHILHVCVYCYARGLGIEAQLPATGGGGFVPGFLTATGGGCRCMPVIVHTME